jgi:hypothetical protein
MEMSAKELAFCNHIERDKCVENCRKHSTRELSQLFSCCIVVLLGERSVGDSDHTCGCARLKRASHIKIRIRILQILLFRSP